MEFVTFKFTEQRHFSQEFHAYLELRHKVFVQELGWPVWNDGAIEMDQYDNPFATYVLALKHGKLVGGGRVLPDLANWGGWSQMAKDTALGKITTMAPTIVAQGFDFSGAWECSRLVIEQDDLRIAERAQVFTGFIDRITELARAGRAKSLLSISPPTLRPTLERRGYDVVQAGDVFTDAFDGKPYCTLQMTGLVHDKARAA